MRKKIFWRYVHTDVLQNDILDDCLCWINKILYERSKIILYSTLRAVFVVAYCK